jgi:hypothetical protein
MRGHALGQCARAAATSVRATSSYVGGVQVRVKRHRGALGHGQGMVCCSRRPRGHELLGQRGELEPYRDQHSRFGISLLHRWPRASISRTRVARVCTSSRRGVKYLSPVQQESDWTDTAAQEWHRMEPILAGDEQAASALGVVPGVGTVAAGARSDPLSDREAADCNVPQASRGSTGASRKVPFRPCTRTT